MTYSPCTNRRGGDSTGKKMCAFLWNAHLKERSCSISWVVSADRNSERRGDKTKALALCTNRKQQDNKPMCCHFYRPEESRRAQNTCHAGLKRVQVSALLRSCKWRGYSISGWSAAKRKGMALRLHARHRRKTCTAALVCRKFTPSVQSGCSCRAAAR